MPTLQKIALFALVIATSAQPALANQAKPAARTAVAEQSRVANPRSEARSATIKRADGSSVTYQSSRAKEDLKGVAARLSERLPNDLSTYSTKQIMNAAVGAGAAAEDRASVEVKCKIKLKKPREFNCSITVTF